MGVGAVTVNGVTLTSKADRPAFQIEYQANRLNGITKFRFKDDSAVVGGSAIDIREQYELLVTDDGTRVFGGRIATLEPQLDGKNIWWTGSAVSFDVLLDERVIENGVRDASLNRYDDDDVNWLVGFHSELVGTTFVSRLRTQVLPTIDYSGKTIRQALNILAGFTTGPVVWVDMNKAVHWTNPASAQKVVNPGFDGGSGGNWTLDGSASVTDSLGPGGAGDYALLTTGTGSGMHESTQTVTGIVAGKRYLFAVWLWSSVAAKAQVRLDWQNSGSVSQRIDTLTGSGTATWVALKDILIAPATATKVVIRLGGVNNFTGTVRHDNIGLVQETAAWGVSTSPDGSTSFSPYGWREPRRSLQPINRVLVRGLGISGWREHAASIAYYGGRKFEGVVEDDRVTTTDGIDSRAASLFRRYAFPSRTGQYEQTQGGLVAGTWQTVNIPLLNLKSIEWIATLRILWLGNGKMLYSVVYGEAEEDIGAGLVASTAGFTGDIITPGINDPGIAPGDSVAPGTPTNMQLSTGFDTAVDGTLHPALVASWTGVGDADLDAYEGQYDAAIQSEVTFSLSVSGSGGSLPAGAYNVAITGLGAVGGETRGESIGTITVAAGQHLYVTITQLVGASSYKVYARRSGEAPPQANGQTTAVTGTPVEITSEGSGATPPTASDAVGFINPTAFRTATTSITLAPVRGGIYYAARVRAIDRSGNRSAFTAIAGVTAAPDSTAPPIPNGLTAAAGFRLIGARWASVAAPDLAKYELRWAPSIGASPNTREWTKVALNGTGAVIDDLTPDTAYYVQVRAIDTSGNVRTSATVDTAVDADTNPEAGWSNTYTVVVGGLSTTLAASAIAGATNIKVASVTGANVGDLIRIAGDGEVTSDEVVAITNVGTAGAGGTGLDISPALGHAKASGAAVAEVTVDYVTATPLAIGAADFAADSIIARMIYADSIDATDIRAGTLSLGGIPEVPDYLLVYNSSGDEIGRWDQYGLLVKDPTNTDRQVRLLNGVLSFSSDGGATWGTAISADGIDASKITFGAAPGGSNLIPNASFEMSAFSATLQMRWDTTAEWDAFLTGAVNADGVSNLLQLVTFTYA